VSPAENSKPPSGGTITTDRCLTHIRDAAHSNSKVAKGKVIVCTLSALLISNESIFSLRSNCGHDLQNAL